MERTGFYGAFHILFTVALRLGRFECSEIASAAKFLQQAEVLLGFHLEGTIFARG